MQIVDEDTFLNIDGVPDLPPETADIASRLAAFRDTATGRLAVLYMIVAITDDAFTSPPTRPQIKRKFLEYFDDGLAAEGHNPGDVFDAAFDRALAEHMIFDAEGLYVAGFRPSRTP
jgi:hypothetical protein